MICNVATWIVNGASCSVHVTPLFCELWQLQLCLWCNSRCCLSPLKCFMAWEQVTLGTVFPWLFLLILSGSDRMGKFQIPVDKKCRLTGPRKCTFSTTALTLWNILLLEIRPYWPFMGSFPRPGTPKCMEDPNSRLCGDIFSAAVYFNFCMHEWNYFKIYFNTVCHPESFFCDGRLYKLNKYDKSIIKCKHTKGSFENYLWKFNFTDPENIIHLFSWK